MTTEPDTRGARAALVAIVAVAAVLRFWALGSGIPYAIGVDEPQVMNRSLAMMRTGTFNPGFFDYPAFYMYLQLLVACVRFLVGAMRGEWISLGDVSLTDFLLWGRAVTAIFGTLTVLVVYRIGLRWSVRHALLAAGLMAVMPLHVRESHFVLTDVPVTFFVALTCLLALRAHERPELTAFVYAGAAAGLAAGTKYPGGLALIFPLMAAWMTPEARPSRGVVSLATLSACGAAFLLVAPYTLLDLPGFLEGYGRLMASYTGAPPPEPGWQLYLKHLRRAMGWPGFVAILVGCVIAFGRATRGPGRLPWLLVLSFPLVYYWSIAGQTLIFGRYLMPLVPFVCMLAACAVISTAGLLPPFPHRRHVRMLIVAVLTAIVTVPPAVAAVGFNVRHAKLNTAALAYEWIQENLPPGTSVAHEGTDLVLMFAPYQSRHYPQLRLYSYDYYAERGVRYLVASSQIYGTYLAHPERYPKEYADYMTLFGRAREVARFEPSDEHPGAELRILEVR